MKVFISWSGERSRLVAEALRYWLPKVIQAVQPWMSVSDIEKGTRWRTDIANELEQTSIGIICLTPENLGSTWLHFEAGALSKQQQNTYVCTLLYKLEPADIREPLAQFQTTKAQKEDIRSLVDTINNALSDAKLPDAEIRESFDVWWPKLEEKLKGIPEPKGNPEPQRPDREILEEILGLVREKSRTAQKQDAKSQVECRLKTTADWSFEDAQILWDHYAALSNSRYKERLATDEEYARRALILLKAEKAAIHSTKQTLPVVELDG